MALLCEITRHASSTITRHIQACSRMAVMQHDLLCVAYSGTPSWNIIRCKSNTLSGKGKRKDKAHNARMRSYPINPGNGTEMNPDKLTFDFFFGGKSKQVHFYIDTLGKLFKNNKALLQKLLDNDKPCRTKNKMEMSQHDRRAFSAEGKKSTTQCSANRYEGRETEKRSAKPFEDLLDKAHTSVKAEIKTGSTQTEFQGIVKNSIKSGHLSSGTQEIGKENLNRSTTTVDPETNLNLQNATSKLNLDGCKREFICDIKPTLVEIIKNPTKTANDSLVDKSELGFRSEGAVIRGSNFILFDQKSYFTPRSERQQSGCKSCEIDSKKANVSSSNPSMANGAFGRHQSDELQQQGVVIQGSNFIIVNTKSTPMSGRGGRSTKDIITQDINSGPVVTNSTDSVANGNRNTFVLADSVENAMGKRYGKEKGNFVLDNDNPHIIAKSKEAVRNKNGSKQGPQHTVTSAKHNGALREGETAAKQTKNERDKNKHILAQNALGSNKANNFAHETTKMRSMEDNAPLTSFESVIKDSQKLIEQIQKDKQSVITDIQKLKEQIQKNKQKMSILNDPMRGNPPTAMAAKNKVLKDTMAKPANAKMNEDPGVVQTAACDETGPHIIDASKQPRVSVKELKPEVKGNKATENDSTPGTRKKKEEGEPSLYVKPEELGKKIKPQLRELGREKEPSARQNKSCNDPSKKTKHESDKTTSVDFENWSTMLRQRIMNYENLTSRQSFRPSTVAISDVAVKIPIGSKSSSTQTLTPSGVLKSPSAISISAAKEKVHTKTKAKQLDDLSKEIQASFSGEFKRKFSDKLQINSQRNDTSDILTKYSNYLTKDQTTRSNTNLDKDPVVKNPKQELKHSETKLASGDPATSRSSTGVIAKENEKNNAIKLSDRYVIVPASEWAKVRQAFFTEKWQQSRAETIKTQEPATQIGDKKDKHSRTATELSSCQAKVEQRSGKGERVVGLRQSESLNPAAQNCQEISTSSTRRNNVTCDGAKGVSNEVNGTTGSPSGSLVVNKPQNKRYPNEIEACRSRSDTSLGTAANVNTIDANVSGKVAATKSVSSLQMQPQMMPSASQKMKPVPGKGTAVETGKLESVKATVGSEKTKVKSLDEAAVENVDPQEFQKSAQLQQKLMENYERDLIKYELALKKYKAMLSLVKNSTVKK